MNKREINLALEQEYKIINESAESVCSGYFYIKNRKRHVRCPHEKECLKCFRYDKGKNIYPHVKHIYVDSFRNCKLYEKYKLDEANMCHLVTYAILYINELALLYINDIKSVVDKSDKESAKIMAALRKRTKSYFNLINEIMGDTIYAYCDFCDSMDEITKPYVSKLYGCIHNFLVRKGVVDSKKTATIELAWVLTVLSEEIRKKIISETNKANKKILSLHVYNLLDTSTILKNLLKWEVRKEKFETLDLNQDKEVKAALLELDGVAANFIYIAECINKNYK